MTNYIQIPKDLDRDLLVKDFGQLAVCYYENRLEERKNDGKVYNNPLKTIYIWAHKDKQTGQGFYSTYRVHRHNSRKQKNYGSS